jgi:hypothetical protein
LDFYLFGKVKSAPIGRKIPDEIDFLEAVTETLNSISGAELQCVFRSWIEDVENVKHDTPSSRNGCIPIRDARKT